MNFSGDFPTLGPLIIWTSVLLCVVAAVLVAFRFWQIYQRRIPIGLEDYTVATSLVILIVLTGIAIAAAEAGFGTPAKDIRKAGGNLHKALFYFFLFQVVYKINICLNKLAFLTLYLRLFPQRSVRHICYATIAIVVTGTLAFVIATITECIPVEKNWNKKIPAHCINNTAFRWSWAGFNTVTDLWVCLLPIPILWRLQMSLAKRLGTMLMFALGLFIVAASAIRMKALVQAVHTNSGSTWGSAPTFVWSHVEASVGLIATCLPPLRAPLARLLPKIFAGTTRSRTRSNAAYQMQPSSNGQANSSSRSNKAVGGGDQAVHITTHAMDGEFDGRDSQEHILKPSSRITVQRDISISTSDHHHP